MPLFRGPRRTCTSPQLRWASLTTELFAAKFARLGIELATAVSRTNSSIFGLCLTPASPEHPLLKAYLRNHWIAAIQGCLTLALTKRRLLLQSSFLELQAPAQLLPHWAPLLCISPTQHLQTSSINDSETHGGTASQFSSLCELILSVMLLRTIVHDLIEEHCWDNVLKGERWKE